MKYKRIYILGTGGAGKTYLADYISSNYKIPHLHLDDIFWLRKYTKKRSEKYRLKKLKEIAKTKKWIIEGAYATWTPYAIKKADLVIWLYPHEYIMAWRVFKRFFERKFKHNSKDNLFDLFNMLKFVLGYKIVKRKEDKTGYERHKELVEKSKAELIIIKSKKQLNDFLAKLENHSK